MQDPDPKCRHFGILWQFGIFAKKSDRKSDPIFLMLSDFFQFLDFSRLSDSTALVSICIMTRKCVLLDEDNAGKISLEVELVMPIWKFGSGLHLISILPKLLTNYADGGGIWCILIKLEFTCFFIDINFFC